MNIFVLDNDPIIAARYHCDKHVLKMEIESLQMLASVHWKMHGITSKKQIDRNNDSVIWKNFPRQENGHVRPYGIGYMHHPCTKWIMDSQHNWEWLLKLTTELIEEHNRRWGKYPSAYLIAKWFRANKPLLPDIGMTPFVQAMPIELKSDDAVHSYRKYYAVNKQYFAKWKFEIPPWWNEYTKSI